MMKNSIDHLKILLIVLFCHYFSIHINICHGHGIVSRIHSYTNLKTSRGHLQKSDMIFLVPKGTEVKGKPLSGIVNKLNKSQLVISILPNIIMHLISAR